jgi:hypothetical protein
VPLGVRVVDGDAKAHPQVVAVAESAPEARRSADLSRVLFQEAQEGLSSLLSDLRATPSDIWWEKSGDIGSGPARLLLIGRALAVVGKAYAWREVAGSRGDILDVQLLELAPGVQAVAVRSRETGGGGAREVQRLHRLVGDAFQIPFAAEVAKQVGQSRLTTQADFVRRGRTLDIVLTPKPPQGFTAETYSESPATDVEPILLPWRDKRARYVWKGQGYVRAE